MHIRETALTMMASRLGGNEATVPHTEATNRASSASPNSHSSQHASRSSMLNETIAAETVPIGQITKQSSDSTNTVSRKRSVLLKESVPLYFPLSSEPRNISRRHQGLHHTRSVDNLLQYVRQSNDTSPQVARSVSLHRISPIHLCEFKLKLQPIISYSYNYKHVTIQQFCMCIPWYL